MKKLFISLAITIAALTALLSCTALTAGAYGVKGDVDGDFNTSIMDATLIQKHCVSNSTLSKAAQQVADINCDGVIDVDDVTTLQRYLVGIVDELPSNAPKAEMDSNGYINYVVRD